MKGIFFALALSASSAYAAQIMDANQLNKILQDQHAGWVAKDNALNQAGVNAAKAMMGAQTVKKGIRFHSISASISRATHLPAVLDWRDNNGAWVTPILDQGNCGSCVAFATIATLETQYRISSGLSLFNIRLSPQALMSCGGGSCGGWNVGPAASYVKSHGVPAESCFPYTSGSSGEDVTCHMCKDSAMTMVKASSVTTPTSYSFDINALKQALQSGPLATDLDVYADFMLYSSGVYKHTTGDDLGGHAVSIVGYDDNKQALIIRNSWGTGWGENGFAYVSYDDVSGIGDSTWGFKMPSMAGGVTVESPVDYSFFTGKADVKAQSTYSDTDSMSVAFFNQSGKSVWSGSCQANACAESVNVISLPDGQYTVSAVAMDNTGKTLGTSFNQTFYVVNKQPKMTMSFTGVDTDLSKPLKGDVNIELDLTTSNNLPMNNVEFHYKDAKGNETVRTAGNVADGMQLTWGTDLHPNGQYEIWFVGHQTTNAFDATVETSHMTVTLKN